MQRHFRKLHFDIPQLVFRDAVADDLPARETCHKAGVAASLKPSEEDSIPRWLWAHEPDQEALAELDEDQRYGPEKSATDVFDRLAGTWTYWGWKAGYFDAEEDAQTYYDEMRYMLCRQMAAPNSPQWFNTGLPWAFGIGGPAPGHHFAE